MDPIRPVHRTADLAENWRFIAGPWGYSQRQLFVLFFEPDGTPLPNITNVTELERDPESTHLTNLVWACGQIAELAGHGSVAVMYCRPGSGPATHTDDVWCKALHDAFAQATYRVWPLFMATDDGVQQVPPDALVA